MAKTQKNKKTEYHLGRLKAQLAKLRRELLDPVAGKSQSGEGFAVQKFGDARVSLVGFPSVGKSSMLSVLTKTQSKIAAEEFTTLTCIPGNLKINDATIQLLDLPGIVEGAASGKGNGRQVLAVAKASDLLLIVLDPAKGVEQKIKILHELNDMGIRINKEQPNISIIRKKTGGLNFTSTCALTHLNQEMVKVILQEYKLNNVDLIIRGDYTVDDLIDAIEGNRKYIEAVFVYNKIDLVSLEDVEELAMRPNSVVVSVNMKLNLEYLLKVIWSKLNLVRIYTKKHGFPPDLEHPIILTKKRQGCTIEAVCDLIHREFKLDFKRAYVWGRSAKFSPQECGLTHELCDEDVIQVFVNKKKRDLKKGEAQKRALERQGAEEKTADKTKKKK